MFASVIIVTFVMNRQVENGGSSEVFGRRSKTTNGKSMDNLGEDKAEISGV